MLIALYILIAIFVGLLLTAGFMGYQEWQKSKDGKLKAEKPFPLFGGEGLGVRITHPLIKDLHEQYASVLIGQHDVFVGLMGCWLAGGHALLTGLPGTGKTLAVKTFVQIMGLDLGRVQGTSDLIPADIVGSLVYNPKTSEFDTVFGPVMHECILVDEINRMPSKTQSALLQAMAEGNISIGQTQYNLPEHFMVFATQNPHDRVGTFPLPAAQLDRFMCEIVVEAPGLDEQSQILNQSSNRNDSISLESIGRAVFASLQQEYDEISVPPSINTHVAQLIQDKGLSSRAGQQLIAFARAIALMQGKSEVEEQDTEVSIKYVVEHRTNKL